MSIQDEIKKRRTFAIISQAVRSAEGDGGKAFGNDACGCEKRDRCIYRKRDVTIKVTEVLM